jgi:hypothetical protein
MEGSMAEIGKPSTVAAAAFIVAWGLVGLAPTATMAQIPFPMIPNFNFGPQHYRSSSSHYSTPSHSRHDEGKTPDKAQEKDATQPEPTASASAPRQQQTSSAPPSHDAAPSGGSDAPASPPPGAPSTQTNDDQPAFQPSR